MHCDHQSLQFTTTYPSHYPYNLNHTSTWSNNSQSLNLILAPNSLCVIHLICSFGHVCIIVSTSLIKVGYLSLLLSSLLYHRLYLPTPRQHHIASTSGRPHPCDPPSMYMLDSVQLENFLNVSIAVHPVVQLAIDSIVLQTVLLTQSSLRPMRS